MGFRDDTEALRARVQVLEAELEDARDQLGRLAAVTEERDRLSDRVGELERELEKLRPKPKPKAKPEPAPRPRPPSSSTRGKRPSWWLGGAILAAVVILGITIALIQQPNLLTGGLDDDVPPTIGMIDLARTPSPLPIRGDTRGAHGAPGDCRGHVPDAPQIVLRLARPTAVRIAPTSSTDIVLVVRTSEGDVFCDDDTDGSNPVVSRVLPAGDHRLWVGTYAESGSATFELAITASEVSAMPDESGLATRAAPSLGARRLEPGADAILEGTSVGFVEASRVSSGCRGSVPVVPHLAIELARETPVSIETTSDTDLVLLVRAADGRFLCDDDSGPGNAPRIAGVLPAGRQTVWVGTFGRSTSPAPFALTARAHAPVDPRAAPSQGTLRLTAVESVLPVEVSLEAQAPPTLLGFDPSCAGLLPERATLAVDVSSAVDVTLASSSPVLLAVRHPDGTRACSTPPMRSTWGPGRHALYVGTIEGQSAPAQVTLSVQSSAPSVVPFTR